MQSVSAIYNGAGAVRLCTRYTTHACRSYTKPRRSCVSWPASQPTASRLLSMVCLGLVGMAGDGIRTNDGQKWGRRGECAFSRANAISRAFLGGTVFPSFLLFVCCYSFISPRATAVARCCRTGALVLWKRTRVRSINDVMSARSGGRSAGLYDATVLNNFFSL